MGWIRKLLKKDKYGIVRGTTVLVLLILLSAALVMLTLMSMAHASTEARAADTANRVAAQFEGMLHSAFVDIYGAAKLVREDPSREDMFLDALYEFSPYTEVGVLSDGILTHTDGSTRDIIYSTSYVYSVEGVPRGRIIAMTDGSLLLCAAIEDGREIAACYDAELLDSILGSSFPEDYDFAVYNANTGSYLVNHTSFASGGYYDALLDLNVDGSTSVLFSDETATAHVRRYHGGAFIAQHRSEIRPWNVALVISESALMSTVWDARWLLLALAGCLLLVIGMHIFFIFFTNHKIKAEQQEAERALHDSQRMLNDMAQRAQVTLFVYHRGQDTLMNCYDGLGLLGEIGPVRQITTLNTLEMACGLVEEDAERLHEKLGTLSRGASAELTLRCALPDREERILRFDLNAHAADGEVIVCSISDYTREALSRNREESERKYMEATIPRTIAAWTINVSRNLWHNIYMKDPSAMGALQPLCDGSWRDYTADLDEVLREYICALDYSEHALQMSIPAIAESYRAGHTEFKLDYRINSPKYDDYEWHRLLARLYTEHETGDIMANVYIFNVDVEKKAELERGERKRVFKKTMRALSGIFFALYYVDLDNDICYAAKSYDGEVETKLSAPYRETFDRYLEGVHPDDREELRAMLDTFSIRRALNEGTHFLRREYRRFTGECYRWATLVIQPARYENGTIREVVIAMRFTPGRQAETE